MDESSGASFSEYVAILSGNTDLLGKAKLDKKIVALESEKHAFIRSKSTSRSRLEEIIRTVDGNGEMISRLRDDWELFNTRVQLDANCNKSIPNSAKNT